MIPREWFDRYAPGFANLTAAELQAIHDFSLVWSLFEAKVLNWSASANAITAKVLAWGRDGKLAGDPFAEATTYFQDRYFENGQPSYRFAHLHLRQNDRPDLVTRVLRGDAATSEQRAACALIVAYRYRNNLFHGQKWEYAIHEQKTNFEVASGLLMRAVDLHAGA